MSYRLILEEFVHDRSRPTLPSLMPLARFQMVLVA